MKCCPSCGKEIPFTADFCPSCGVGQPRAVNSRSRTPLVVTPTARAARLWKRAMVVATIVVVLFILGAVAVKVLHFSRDVQQSLVSKDVQGCMTELDGSTHCDFLRRTPSGLDIDLRQCTKEELMAGKAPCWANQPIPGHAVSELERLPRAEWVHLQTAEIRMAHGVPTRYTGQPYVLALCKPGFRCYSGPTLNVDTKGPFYSVNQVDLDRFPSRPPLRLMRLITMGDLSADERLALQGFCQQGFRIFQLHPVADSTGDVTHLFEDVPLCNGASNPSLNPVPTPAANSPVANSQGDTGADPQMRWGMSKEQVSQTFHSGDKADVKLEEAGTDALVYRNDAATTSDHTWYYFQEGKLVETRQIQVDGYPPSWYDEMREKMTKKYGQPVPGTVPAELKPVRADIFGSPRSLLILILSKNDDCPGDPCVSEIFLDRSQPGLAVR